jgi:hypothetical protein
LSTFSSAVRKVPQGVWPPAQLFSVPRTMTPAGSTLVRSSGWPRAGPVISQGVSPVMRRAQRLPGTCRQRPRGSRSTSSTLTPCMARVSGTTCGWRRT